MNFAWKLRPSDKIHKVMTFSNFFSKEEIEKIKSYASTLDPVNGLVGFKANEGIPISNSQIRKCEVKWVQPVDETKWIYQKLVDFIYRVNGEFFNLNLYAMQALQYTIYKSEEPNFYSAHRDTGGNSDKGLSRKLSFSLQLSDPSEYEGGELVVDVNHDPIVASKEFGALTFFLSDLVHEVTPVTKGKRDSLVGWIIGPTMM